MKGDDILRQPRILHNRGAVDLGEQQFGHLRQSIFRLDGKVADAFSVSFANLDCWPRLGLAMSGQGDLRQRRSCRRGALEKRDIKGDDRFCPGLRRT